MRLPDYIRNVLLCYDDDLFEAMARRIARSCNVGDMIVLKTSPTALVGRFGLGAPAVVTKCEELIACGARRIISLGTAAFIGALPSETIITKKIGIGDLLVCEKAFSDEGTSRHYVPSRKVFRATQRLADEVHDHLNQKGLRCKAGIAWTTDAPYRETVNKRDAFLEKAADVVEMEASALYMIARYRKVQAVSVFVVGDSIAEETWQPHFNERPIRMLLKQTGRALLDFLVSGSARTSPL